MDSAASVAFDDAPSASRSNPGSPNSRASDDAEFQTAVDTVRTVGATGKAIVSADAEAQSFEDQVETFEEAAAALEQAEAEAAVEEAENSFIDEVDTSAQRGDVHPAAVAAAAPDNVASDGTYGKTEHIVLEGETLSSIAAQYGQTVQDLLLANPSLSADTHLSEGQIVAVYDAGRLEIVREMSGTTSPEKLAELVRREILYATRNSATPQDLLAIIKGEILARRPGDTQFAAIVTREGVWASDLWVRQGRTHEMMSRLETLSERGDSESLKRELLQFLENTARRSPSSTAIENQIEIFERYGPKDGVFAEALQAAAYEFNHGRIEVAAAHLADAYCTSGPVQASRLLAELTAPAHFDALSAARLLDVAGVTIAQIVAHLSADETRYTLGDKQTIFGYISRAVEYASKSADAAAPIRTIAIAINAQMFTYVEDVMLDGMVVLPGNMLNERPSSQLIYSANTGAFGRSSLVAALVQAYNHATRIAPEEERQLSARLFNAG